MLCVVLKSKDAVWEMKYFYNLFMLLLMILHTFIDSSFLKTCCLRANMCYKENSIYLYGVLLCQNIPAVEYVIPLRMNIKLFYF